MYKTGSMEGNDSVRKLVLAVAAILSIMWGATAFAGQIVMDGSTTVLPFGQAAAERFMHENSGVTFSVSGTGTGNGFKSLADGSAQIAGASRFIKDFEIKTCMDKKVYPVPFAVALDCIVPIVHKTNPVGSLTKAQLRDIYAGDIKNWKDVGGGDAPIVVVGRDTSSGTYGTWQEMIMDQGKKTRVTARAQVASSSGAMLQSVTQNNNAIGYEGIGYVTSAVKAVPVGGVAASAARARSGTYPLARYLYMFTNGWPEGELLDFINFMQGAEGQKIVGRAGFIPLREIK